MAFEGKIFGIGFHKTGTSSLAAALRILGYRVTGPNGVWHPQIREHALDMARGLVARYDAFQDNPWPMLYEQLDREFPGSKFILTLRPTSDWVQSAVHHFEIVSTPMRDWIYGIGQPIGSEHVYRDRYEKHNRDVLAYFANRSQDLLTIRITEGEGWEILCPFLDLPIPTVPFPHANKSGEWLNSELREFLVRTSKVSR